MPSHRFFLTLCTKNGLATHKNTHGLQKIGQCSQKNPNAVQKTSEALPQNHHPTEMRKNERSVHAVGTKMLPLHSWE